MPFPDRIDRYRIIEKIAEGAMGIVFKAEDPAISRTVAIKVIQLYPGMDEFKQEEMRKRFKREAQAAGRLNHPNIVTIYDVGEYKGSTYIVMEYIEGTNLDEIRRTNGIVPFEKAIKYGTEIASALDYAHTKGVIHRDVKPSNILIDKDDHVKVVDFGIAKLVDSDLTQPYQILGSPSYMSPEQIMGGKLDGRSDVFSTAILFYYILTGKKPFEGESISSIVQRILNDNPEPPSSLKKDLPPQVDYAILKALSKDPKDRFSTVMEFVESLKREEKLVDKMPIRSAGDIFRKLLEKMNFNVTRMDGDEIDMVAVAEQKDPLLKGRYLFRINLKPEGMKVGISVLREVLQQVQERRFTKALIITNTEFTDECWDFVEEKPLELINGEELEELFKKHYPTGSYELKQRLPVKSHFVPRTQEKTEEDTTQDVTPSDRIFMTKTQESRRLFQPEKGSIFKNLWRKK